MSEIVIQNGENPPAENPSQEVALAAGAAGATAEVAREEAAEAQTAAEAAAAAAEEASRTASLALSSPSGITEERLQTALSEHETRVRDIVQQELAALSEATNGSETTDEFIAEPAEDETEEQTPSPQGAKRGLLHRLLWG